MESDLQHHHHHQEQNSGLMRYRSAPSSYFTEMLDREFCQQFFNRPSSPETERIFARFMNSGDDDVVLDPPKHTITNPNPNPNPSQSSNNNINNNSASRATGFYQSASKPPLPTSSVGEGAYSMGINSPQFPPMRTGGVATSGLVRHSSSPAGLFANINIDSVMGELTGFGAMRGMGTYGGGGGNNNNSSGKLEDASFMPASRSLKRTSSTGPMSPIAENDDKANNYASSFTIGSWDDIPDNITDLKRIRDDEDVKPFSGLNNNTTHENQNAEAGNRPPMLAHHLSLPKTQSEMAAIEKFLQFRDSVPCKIRAKRGCATHPRSIAERVRRTRISERMRKLQDLVPNMEKQTNTADMLDLAVEYIKDLQNQVQTLDDIRAKCTCSNKQQKQQ